MKFSRSLRKLGGQIEDTLDQVTQSGANSSRVFLRKFNRRTPYDLYSHSGDQASDVEFGVGV